MIFVNFTISIDRGWAITEGGLMPVGPHILSSLSPTTGWSREAGVEMTPIAGTITYGYWSTVGTDIQPHE